MGACFFDASWASGAASASAPPAGIHCWAPAGLGKGGAFRLGADMGRIAGAVGVAEGVPAGDQGHGLLIVHGHAAEGFANVAGSLEGIRIAVGALGIDVNQPHLHRAEGIVELAIAAIALVV